MAQLDIPAHRWQGKKRVRSLKVDCICSVPVEVCVLSFDSSSSALPAKREVPSSVLLQ